jgi:large subunit ribosomal protein L23
MKEGRDIIRTICLTEKATLLSENLGKYVFKVDPKANKVEIRNAVESIFKVKVSSVNTANYEGKLRRERTRHYGRRPSWKKAIVTLKEGERLDLV